jgi:hypothetical protein
MHYFQMEAQLRSAYPEEQWEMRMVREREKIDYFLANKTWTKRDSVLCDTSAGTYLYEVFIRPKKTLDMEQCASIVIPVVNGELSMTKQFFEQSMDEQAKARQRELELYDEE